MIVGATPESDYQILNLSAALYRPPVAEARVLQRLPPRNVADPLLPATDAVQLNREHRLYQADWLLRFYGFNVSEIIDEDNPFLAPDVDPKANWALNHLDFFPVEVNSAPLEALLRVPGIGVRGAKLILRARRQSTLGEAELRKLGIAYKRARYFITMNGACGGSGVDFSREALHARLAAPIDGGRHGRRADRAPAGQMSLFETVEAPPVLPEASPDAATAREVAFAAQRRALETTGTADRAASGRNRGGIGRRALDRRRPQNARQPAALGGLGGRHGAYPERIRGRRPCDALPSSRHLRRGGLRLRRLPGRAALGCLRRLRAPRASHRYRAGRAACSSVSASACRSSPPTRTGPCASWAPCAASAAARQPWR